MITWLPGRPAQRVAAVDRLVVTASAQRRLRMRHPALDRAGLAVAEAGVRQWFRLVARRPRAALVIPSRLVDDLWAELVLDPRTYGEFCQATFGRLLRHEPVIAPTAAAIALRGSEGLRATLRSARADEGPGAGVPLLFRADREAGLAHFRYVADCGARGDCHVRIGEVCLHHLGGIERWARRGSASVDRSFETYGYGVGDGIGDRGGGGHGGP